VRPPDFAQYRNGIRAVWKFARRNCYRGRGNVPARYTVIEPGIVAATAIKRGGTTSVRVDSGDAAQVRGIAHTPR
jgi:hypothetical protein